MSLEEAIKKYEALAENHSKAVQMGLGNPDRFAPSIEQHQKLATEYRQVAGWLQELKERREKERREGGSL